MTSLFLKRRTLTLTLFVVLVCGVPSTAAAQQWNGPDANGNISNANSGKVGIGVSSSLGTLLTVGRDLELHSWSDGTTRWALVQGYDRSTSTIRPIWLEGSKFFFSGGNVGIGTTSPSSSLEIRKDVGNNVGPVITLSNITGGPGAGSTIDFSNPALAVPQQAQIRASDNNDWSSNLLFLTKIPGGGANALAERVRISSSGKVGIGTTNPEEKLHVAGSIKVDGNINAKYQDLAEWVPSSEQLSAGTVVVLDTTKSNQVTASGTAYDTRVAGVISAQPGITLGESGEGRVLVATTGRVRVKVDASRGPIQIGDLLVTSDVSGVAMKSEAVEFAGRKMHMPGTIIGKALEPLAKGSGEILVLLSLQ